MTSKTPATDLRRGLVTAALGAAGAAAGFVDAIVLIPNLHIFAGVEDGYVATPTQVLARSVWIFVVDAVILITAPGLPVTLVIRLRHVGHHASQRRASARRPRSDRGRLVRGPLPPVTTRRLHGAPAAMHRAAGDCRWWVGVRQGCTNLRPFAQLAATSTTWTTVSQSATAKRISSGWSALRGRQLVEAGRHVSQPCREFAGDL